jgi:hypothetical protein
VVSDAASELAQKLFILEVADHVLEVWVDATKVVKPSACRGVNRVNFCLPERRAGAGIGSCQE